MYRLIKTNLLLLLFVIFSNSSFAQTMEGSVSYSAAAPERIIFTGEYRPTITLGDSVGLVIKGQINLRPYEVEKKKGGFFGIGAKRYKERHDNIIDAKDVKVKVELSGTAYGMEEGSERGFVFNNNLLNIGDDPASAIKQEYYLSGFINEGGKNLFLGWSRILISVKLETVGRIKYILKYLSEEKPTTFSKIQPILEMGNVLKQHPNELARDIVSYYKQYQPDRLSKIKKDLYEYLLIKSPSNMSIRADLAITYVENLQFTSAATEGKKVIASLEGTPDDKLLDKDREALATAYRALADVSSLEKLGTQKNAYSVAAYYYGLSAKYCLASGLMNDFGIMTMKQVKALQAVSSIESLTEAAKILEKYLATAGSAKAIVSK